MLTMPVTLVARELCFSKPQIITNYLTTTTTQEKPDRFALLIIEKEVASNIDYSGLIAESVAGNRVRWISSRKRNRDGKSYIKIYNFTVNLKETGQKCII